MDRQFNGVLNHIQKVQRRTFAAVLTLWLIGAVIFVAFWGTIYWVAYHFISKFW